MIRGENGSKIAAVRDIGSNFARLLFVGVLFGGWGALLLTGVSLAEIQGLSGALGVLVVASLAVTLLQAVYGATNALFGLGMLAVRRRPQEDVLPELRTLDSDAPIKGRTGVVTVVHNEDPEVVFSRLARTIRSARRLGLGERLVFFLLSDTTDPGIAAEEERRWLTLRGELAQVGVELRYRRRADNRGHKVGNLREWGARHLGVFDYFVVLDADSVLEGADLGRLIRLMDQNAPLGMVQTLVLGTPSKSPFARLFQYGMRAGMRTHALGAAVWQADAGPCWGHNVIVRLRPYMEDCELPGPYLSHDQVEAALMRAAGYHVRVYPVEGGSFEDNPPDLVEFIRRDLRWCQGNLQYLRLLLAPGFRWMGRIQLAIAILMYMAPVAWMVGTLAAFLVAAEGGVAFMFDLGFVVLPLILLPKLAGYLETLAKTPLADVPRVLLSMVAELFFSFFLAPIAGVSVFLFVVSLTFGHRMRWESPRRHLEGLPLRTALRRFAPHTAIGWVGVLTVGLLSPAALPYSLPIVGPLILSAPFASFTASPRLGSALQAAGLCAAPGESTRPLRASHEPTASATTLG